MVKNNDWKRNNWFWISMIWIVIFIVLIIVIITQNNERDKNIFSLDKYMESRYVSGEISLNTLLEYKHASTQNMYNLGIALAAVFAGLGIMFHGLTLVDARHHMKTVMED